MTQRASESGSDASESGSGPAARDSDQAPTLWREPGLSAAAYRHESRFDGGARAAPARGSAATVRKLSPLRDSGNNRPAARHSRAPPRSLAGRSASEPLEATSEPGPAGMPAGDSAQALKGRIRAVTGRL